MKALCGENTAEYWLLGAGVTGTCFWCCVEVAHSPSVLFVSLHLPSLHLPKASVICVRNVNNLYTGPFQLGWRWQITIFSNLLEFAGNVNRNSHKPEIHVLHTTPALYSTCLMF